ncbi:MAG: histidine--tRNA ligase [Rhodospirillales bacterium]|jgi:histidyl-tRNA synthetase|nr:histidine--tRNA ligase [Rhodospirillales bacterium]MBT4039576.1 histidine--tRNA ligase [Rhodospirillales bacterium]MBT4625937.1 histidine--tRNA ligase [Rhodospirillales bacterium]MBT5350708.1 histidine--tRNA ligase [Rhodospirillales bacterium]MBT5522070.1 histidine--tRNA ligase [Rhodospirillales bacterium]
MSSLQPVRGTHDLLPEEMRRHRAVTDAAQSVSAQYGYEEIATPIFEFTNVFSRTLGDTSDVVTKEMYTFEDKGGEMITLRPENTASVMRAYLSNGLQQTLPCRFFYRGPMFRYERPQKGRQRQFHQIGIECIGIPAAEADVEVIATGAHILKSLGILDRTTLEINSLGDTDSRNAYRDTLVEYFSKYESSLSKDSKERLTKNPMRILDSKDENDRKIVADAPLMPDSMNAESKGFFETVLMRLDQLGIAYNLNTRLVRGLDYYCHTAFEFTTTELGAQGAVMAGGRYDGLITQMGGPATPGVGWAAGVERMSMMIDEPTAQANSIAIVPIGDEAFDKAFSLAHQLRHAGFAIDFGVSGNMKKRMKRADRVGAVAALMIGEDELARDGVTIRDMETGEQTEASFASLESQLDRYR